MQDGKHVILCIDDDVDITDSLKAVLESNGYAVAVAATAEEGLQVYKQVKPDLVIVDLMMEEVDAGTSFIKDLKLAENKAPVYMLSSVGDNLAITTDYTALGLAGVFQKPIDFEKLLGILKAKLG